MPERGPEQFLSRSEEKERQEKLAILDRERIELLNQKAEMEAKKESLGVLCESQQKELLSLEENIKNLIKQMKELGAGWV